jgi:hypothetical protein
MEASTKPTLTGNRCQCSACGEYFNSSTAFDRHRVGSFQHRTRRCLSIPEMTARGFCKNPAGFWMTESRKARADRGAASANRRGGVSKGYPKVSPGEPMAAVL